MHVDRLEKRATEKELVAQPSSDKDLSLSAELLRSRIEELDGLNAVLNSDHRIMIELRNKHTPQAMLLSDRTLRAARRRFP